MTLPVVDQEFVVHLFAPLDGPHAESAYRQVQGIWTDGLKNLSMTEPIAGLPLGLSDERAALPADGVAAARENLSADRQGVLRRVHDALNLSVAFTQPAAKAPTLASESGYLPGQREKGWADFAQLWGEAAGRGTAVVLGEARLFMARTPPGSTQAVPATAELGQSLDPLLPHRKERPRDWWRWGTTTAAGYAVWDTRPTDISSVREIVVIAPADQDAEMSAWAWSDGTSGIPPFARYLLYAAKLRYEARLLAAWHQQPGADEVAEVQAELNAMLTREALDASDAGPLRSLLRRLRAQEDRLSCLKTDLELLKRAVSNAHANLRAVARPDRRTGSTGMFAADEDLARWLIEQTDSDLSYTGIDVGRVHEVRSLAAEELNELQRSSADDGMTAPTPPPAPEISRKVFIVHGRDDALVAKFRDLLRTVGLEPLEWELLVRATGSTAPSLAQVVAMAPRLAQATLVLLSPDDIVELHHDLFLDNDGPAERVRSMQARPNVFFELGLAMMASPNRTIVVEVGEMRPVADLAGLNVIRFTGSGPAIKKVLDRLQQADCPVDLSGTDWMDPGRFDDMAAYQRCPDSGSE